MKDIDISYILLKTDWKDWT